MHRCGDCTRFKIMPEGMFCVPRKTGDSWHNVEPSWEGGPNCPMGDAVQARKIAHCRGCRAEVVWMKTRRGKNIQVEADTFHHEKEFQYGRHIAHFSNCPKADEFRRS